MTNDSAMFETIINKQNSKTNIKHDRRRVPAFHGSYELGNVVATCDPQLRISSTAIQNCA